MLTLGNYYFLFCLSYIVYNFLCLLNLNDLKFLYQILRIIRFRLEYSIFGLLCFSFIKLFILIYLARSPWEMGNKSKTIKEKFLRGIHSQNLLLNISSYRWCAWIVTQLENFYFPAVVKMYSKICLFLCR